MDKVRTSFWIDKQIRDQAKVRAALQSVTLSSLVENYLARYLDEPQLEILKQQAIEKHLEEQAQ